MSGAVIGRKKCTECDGTVSYTETKSGGISGSCDSCKAQFFHRSPKAVDGIKRNLASANAPAGEPAGGSERQPAGFDLSKL